MNPKVKQKFQALEEQRSLLYKMTDHLTDDQANIKPKDNGWSLAQVYYHIYLIESNTFDYLSHKIKEGVEVPKSGFKEWYRSTLLKFFLKLPIKYRAPRRVSEPIPEEVDFKEVKTKWAEVREGMKLLLEVLTPQQIESQMFTHPRIGKINIYQTLEFLKDHHHHHLPQIKNRLSTIEASLN